MTEISVNLSFVTPAFIGGADQNCSEFRIPSLKGLLRFWWRAYQECSSEDDLAKLYEKESRIFGSSAQKAAFTMQIKPVTSGISVRSSNRSLRLVQNPGAGDDPIGVKYLFYSMYPMGSSQGRPAPLREETSVNVLLRFRSDDIIKDVVGALWLLENFGGIGARSRRGAGSFRVVSIAPMPDDVPRFISQNTWEFGPNENASKKIEEFLRRGVAKLGIPKDQTVAPYTAFRATISKVKVLSPYEDWIRAADDAGRRMATFRRSDLGRSEGPFHDEARALHGFAVNPANGYNGPDPLTKTAFGLPIIYNFRKPDGQRGLIPETVEASYADKGRRASPLFIKIGRLPSGDSPYYVVFLSLWATFLPQGSKVHLDVKRDRTVRGSHDLDQPTNGAIDDFFRSLL